MEAAEIMEIDFLAAIWVALLVERIWWLACLPRTTETNPPLQIISALATVIEKWIGAWLEWPANAKRQRQEW